MSRTAYGNGVFNKKLTKKFTKEEEKIFNDYQNQAQKRMGVISNSIDIDIFVPREFGERFLKDIGNKITPLRNYVKIIRTEKLKGVIPFDNIAELKPMEVITDGIEQTPQEISINSFNYEITEKFGFYEVTPSVHKDTTLFPEYLESNFSKRKVLTENDLILKALEGKEKRKILTNDLKTEIKNTLKKILNPEFSKDAVIITNQTGAEILSLVSDVTGNYLVKLDINNEERIEGKKLIVFSDLQLPNVGIDTPLIIGSLNEAVALIDPELDAIAINEEGTTSFKSGGCTVRQKIRNDVKLILPEAFEYIIFGEAAQQ